MKFPLFILNNVVPIADLYAIESGTPLHAKAYASFSSNPNINTRQKKAFPFEESFLKSL